MTTIYLSLSAQVAKRTFFMKYPAIHFTGYEYVMYIVYFSTLFLIWKMLKNEKNDTLNHVNNKIRLPLDLAPLYPRRI